MGARIDGKSPFSVLYPCLRMRQFGIQLCRVVPVVGPTATGISTRSRRRESVDLLPTTRARLGAYSGYSIILMNK